MQSGEALPHRSFILNSLGGYASLDMVRISRTNPFYYQTSVTKDRLPVFRTDKIKEIAARAFDEARTSGGIFIFAYVIMPDHTHTATYSPERSGSDILRFMNGISARRIIGYLKDN